MTDGRPMHVWTIPAAIAVGLACYGPALAQDALINLGAIDELIWKIPGAEVETPAARADVARDSAAQMRVILGDAIESVDPVPQIAATVPPAPEMAPARISNSDLQIAMTQLAIDAGTNDMLTVVRAQGAEPTAIFVNEGSATLSDVAASGTNGISRDGNVFTLTEPLIIWSDAALTIAPDEVLLIDRGAGAFLLSFGAIDIDGAAVEGAGVENTIVADFEAFVLLAGRGSISATRSRFSQLGIRGTTMFSGLAVVSRGLLRPERPTLLADNAFHDTRTVYLAGTEGAQITGNLVYGDDAGGLILSGGTGAVIANNDVMTGNTGSAIRVTDGAENISITHNLVLDAPSNGILVDRAVRHIDVSRNIVLSSGDAGIVMRRAACAQMQGNLVVRNAATGIRLQETSDLTLGNNAVLLNGIAGIEILDQPVLGRIKIAHNVIGGNREGLSGASIHQVTLDDNMMSAQLPRLFGGEFAQYLPAYLTTTEQDDKTDFVIAAASVAASAPGPVAALTTLATAAEQDSGPTACEGN